MDIKKISPGKAFPEDINVVIEIPKNSNIKYEVDKESGAIFVDRVLFTAMHYPFNYGFVPNTLAQDGDPADVIVLSEASVSPGSVMRSLVVGMLEMEDEEGIDTKFIAVIHPKLEPTFSNVKDIKDVPDYIKDKIKHFFEHYKELEKGKWVKVRNFLPKEEALKQMEEALKRYNE